jgi:mannose-6-phosphate isomerase-like protein (cupin superfamily)
MKIDEWPWGNEKILWGYDTAHQYTLKVLEPKLGRAGCLSLQKHREKSETWVVMRGAVWVLVAIDGQACTKVLRPFEYVSLPPGAIHRLTAASAGAQVLESSTLDVHAADKSKLKDVVRLHCYLGRPAVQPDSEDERKLVQRCIALSDEALTHLERGSLPPEHNPAWLSRLGGAL